MNKIIRGTITIIIFSCIALLSLNAQQKQPNILWILTDDHRADALECYNLATTGKRSSALGYVSSPNIDKLASEGVLFINAYCNSPACGPSRGSMASGRYPFKTGHYSFELTHQNPDFIKPVVSQILQKEGYLTAAFGKPDEYIYKWGPGQGFYNAGFYNYTMHGKHSLQKNNVGDHWGVEKFTMKDGKMENIGHEEVVQFPDGRIEKYLVKKKSGELSAEDIAKRKQIDKELGILRSYTAGGNKDLIIGGVSPMPADKTMDAMIVKEYQSYLTNVNSTYKTSWGEMAQGANSAKPVMINLGFHLWR